MTEETESGTTGGNATAGTRNVATGTGTRTENGSGTEKRDEARSAKRVGIGNAAGINIQRKNVVGKKKKKSLPS